jgi:predicted RNA binding protein YcfA (HicA-like mRNA interferase family)
MPKARQVLKALQRDGWQQCGDYRGSHVTIVKNGRCYRWAWHDSRDLHKPQLQQIARDCGYTVDQLRGLL